MHLCLAVESIASSLHFCSTVCLFFNQSHQSNLVSPPIPRNFVQCPPGSTLVYAFPQACAHCSSCPHHCTDVYQGDVATETTVLESWKNKSSVVCGPPPQLTPNPGVVKQGKSSGGSVDTTKTRLGPQRVRMCEGERLIGAAKGTKLAPWPRDKPPPHPVVVLQDEGQRIPTHGSTAKASAQAHWEARG